jgi:hypothetical protein
MDFCEQGARMDRYTKAQKKDSANLDTVPMNTNWTMSWKSFTEILKSGGIRISMALN